jgi:Carbohydrate family 9 binding domain-like/Domain of unknown function (DUF5916)
MLLTWALSAALLMTQDTVTITRQPPPVIDGVIAVDEWRDAATVSLDYQVQPGDNVPPSQPTQVRLAFDEAHLYLAFISTDDPAKVRARVTRRDDIAGDDYVMVYLDTHNDRRRAYVFWFNPFGIQADGTFTEGVATGRNFDGNVDKSWDGVIESKGQVNSAGFVVEVAIPLKALRFPRRDVSTWGLHIERWIARDGERISWRPVSRSVSSLLTQMGSLTGLRAASAGPSYELIPTTIASSVDQPDRAIERHVDAGVTGAWSFAPNATVSGTVNPDFSQIESDVPQIEVNQRFPLRYAEKRPFFYDGSQFFQSPGLLNFLDTRQIVDPDWGVKLTAKAGGNSVGLLASSDRAPGLRLGPGTPGEGDNSAVAVLRYQRDVLRNSTVGGFFTSHEFAGARNLVAALDGQLRLPLNTFGLQLSRSWSQNGAAGTADGMATYVWYDFVGRHWRVLLNDQRVTSGYDSRLAFVRRRGVQMQSANIGYEFQSARPSWWVRIRPFVVPRRLENDAGLIDESYVDPGVSLTLSRDISIYTYYSFHQDAYLGREYPYQFYANNLTVNAFKRVSFSTRLIAGEGVNFDPARPMVGRALDATVTMTVKPAAALDSEFLMLNSQLSAPADNPYGLANGTLLFRQRVYRNRTNYQVARSHGLRTIVEYNTLSRRLLVSAVYGFTPRPNTAVYVGFGDLLDHEEAAGDLHQRAEALRSVRRTWFVKMSYGLTR